jgi:hypothetical protein
VRGESAPKSFRRTAMGQAQLTVQQVYRWTSIAGTFPEKDFVVL